ncbi:autoinducer binding domain-containing protein [Salipiger mangrovisoli]|uniref:Response regulator transcription factor n=1 Tax=Salipiger mangrovisoli TaxID=2865933 RepID=A0ABR9WZE6_9RHOB|nr:response regulator transcription factor [Salipiger mangrovisoli]
MAEPSQAPLPAACHVPELLQWFLARLEATRGSEDVWRLFIRLGQKLDLPYVDYVTARPGSAQALSLRASYDAGWLRGHAAEGSVGRWSYLWGHAAERLTPIAVGVEFLEEYHPLPEARVAVLKEAARRGMRAGFSIPLRQSAPPRVGQLSFAGGHSRREMLAIIHAHGWTLNVAALSGHQRFVALFAQEFPERNQITEKQLELLAMIGAGLQDKQIAERLVISVSAVRHRLEALSERTGRASRTELAALAMALGVLPDPKADAASSPDDPLLF